jgi:twitching motility protein PilT
MGTDTPVISAGSLLDELFTRGASDLLLSVGAAPTLRIDGRLVALAHPVLTADDTDRFVRDLLAAPQRLSFADRQTVDFSFEWRDQGRVRGNAFRQRATTAIALRAIPTVIPTFEEIRLPREVARIANQPHGLILVTGPTGCGKSTTQASIIDAINRDRGVHIITIEDPLEYMHANHRAVVDQREIGLDAPSFAEALRSTLREDPDVVLVGEMRDLESIAMALTIAETGHLVLGTLHTNDAAQAVNRVVDVFPAGQQQQIRTQLASTLSCVLHQELLPRINGGRVAAFEVMVATSAVRSLIRENKMVQARNAMVTSTQDGMCTMEMSLNALIAEGLVSYEVALARSLYPKEIIRNDVLMLPGSASEPPELSEAPVAGAS